MLSQFLFSSAKREEELKKSLPNLERNDPMRKFFFSKIYSQRELLRISLSIVTPLFFFTVFRVNKF